MAPSGASVSLLMENYMLLGVRMGRSRCGRIVKARSDCGGQTKCA
jgi:hypothetical protein